jgi:hypothetical protein
MLGDVAEECEGIIYNRWRQIAVTRLLGRLPLAGIRMGTGKDLTL